MSTFISSCSCGSPVFFGRQSLETLVAQRCPPKRFRLKASSCFGLDVLESVALAGIRLVTLSASAPAAVYW